MLQFTMRWVVQQNLGKSSDTDRVMAAARENGCRVIGIDVIPFSTDLPDVPSDMPTVFYGATQFINNVFLSGMWSPGAFYDPETFRFSRYLLEYGESMLNSSVELTTIDLFGSIERDPEKLIFIRPDRDLKEFAGDVIRTGDFQQWAKRVSHGGYTVTGDCPIVIAEPVGISCEWRTFVVNGRVVAGSQYRCNRILDVKESLPYRVRMFVEEHAQRWSPASVFSFDVAQSGDELYVLELGCFNSSGFYGSDIELLIKEISRHITVSAI